MCDGRRYRVYQVDAFTKAPFAGNPAGVVPEAAGLSDEEMQRIAREMNVSETAFVLPPDGDDHDVRVRFFTPTQEVPICGHATVAAQYVRAMEMGLETMRVMQKTGAGVLPVDVVREGDDVRIMMGQGAVCFGDVLDGEVLLRLLSALGLNGADLREDCPVQFVSTGYGKVMVPIRDIGALHRLAPDMRGLTWVSEAIGCNGFYVFVVDAEDADALVHGRMFAPASGVDEDPVTGNASGPVGVYLVRYGLAKAGADGVLQFAAVQGEAMGRPGRVEVEVGVEDGEAVWVRIGGDAVVVLCGEIRV